MKVKQNVSFILKLLTAGSALGGVFISFLQSYQDGYGHWSKRLLYFTGQSNIWIGVIFLILAFAHVFTFSERVLHVLYVLKYVFTVSITLTGLVFCTLLAPFADESYHLFVLSSYLTHIFSPAFAIADLFVDEFPFPLTKRHVFYGVIPPSVYYLSSILFSALKVDFGRGEYYPYYFFNFRSPAGVFGFSNQAPFFIGAFYWAILFFGIIYTIAFVLAKLRNMKTTTKKR